MKSMDTILSLLATLLKKGWVRGNRRSKNVKCLMKHLEEHFSTVETDYFKWYANFTPNILE